MGNVLECEQTTSSVDYVPLVRHAVFSLHGPVPTGLVMPVQQNCLSR